MKFGCQLNYISRLVKIIVNKDRQSYVDICAESLRLRAEKSWIDGWIGRRTKIK
jgi:hypothetical protein